MPEGIPEKVLEAHEDCGADDLQASGLQDDSDSDDADDDRYSDSDDSSDGTHATLRRAAPQRPTEEREIRNRPVPENVFDQWLSQGVGRLAEALRVSLSQRGIDRTADDFVEQVLQLLHDVDAETPRNTAELTVVRLARRVHELFGIGETAVNVDLLYGELRDAVKSLSVGFQHSGLPYSETPELGDPETNLEEDLDALLAGQAGTTARPFHQPARGTIPLSEHRTKGYTTLAFPVLFPFGVGDFSQPRKHQVTWEQWSRHLQQYSDGRFSSHSRFPYFLLNTHEREVANRKAGLYIAEVDKRLTVGELRRMSKAQKEEIAKRVSKYGATLRNTPAFMADRKKELQAMCEQIGDPNVRLAACPLVHVRCSSFPRRCHPDKIHTYVPSLPAGLCHQLPRRHV